MKTLEFKTLINTTDDKLFEFHTDSNNIKEITPSNTKVELLNEDTSTFLNKIIKIKTTKFFISTYWEVKIEKLDYPNILIDIALKSPFKFWRHQHIFTQQNNQCELKDIIEFELPFGILGKLFEPFIELDIRNMFEYRHKKTKEIFEK